MKPPREHGFWVMLGVSLATGSALGRSTATVVVAIVLAAVAVAAAMVVGRKIRKNSLLQALASLFLGGLVVPLGAFGRCSFERSCFYAGALALVFLSTTLSVQAVLLRARRRLTNAQVSNVAALGVAGLALAGLALTGSSSRPLVVLSFAPVLFLGTWLVILQPSAKKLWRIGLSIALVQLFAATALVADEFTSF